MSNSGVYLSIPNIITKSLPTLQNSYLNPTIHPQSFYQHLLHYLPPTGTLTHTIIFITFSIHFQKSYYKPLISPFSKSFHFPQHTLLPPHKFFPIPHYSIQSLLLSNNISPSTIPHINSKLNLLHQLNIQHNLNITQKNYHINPLQLLRPMSYASDLDDLHKSQQYRV